MSARIAINLNYNFVLIFIKKTSFTREFDVYLHATRIGINLTNSRCNMNLKLSVLLVILSFKFQILAKKV